jgi:hypothetical protein
MRDEFLIMGLFKIRRHQQGEMFVVLRREKREKKSAGGG